MHKIGDFSEEYEDYLELIFQLSNDLENVSIEHVASAKGASIQEARQMIDGLVSKSLLELGAENAVALTPKGEDLARRVTSRHDFLSKYLTEILCVPPETAARDAHAITHHLSLETIDRMVSFFEYLRFCPMADKNFLENFAACCAINRSQCEKNSCRNGRECPLVKKTRTLLDLKPGEKGRVLRLTAQGAIRRRLIDMGVLPDVEMELQSIAPLGDPIKIKMKGYSLSLRKKEAEGILLKNGENPSWKTSYQEKARCEPAS